VTADGRVLDDVDAIDLAIIRLLQEQGRTTNAHVARVLGVSEPTVRKHIDRLVADEIIKVVAVLNPGKTGYRTDVIIGIRVESGSLLEVGEALSQRDEVVYLGYLTGRHDILVEMLFRDNEALFDFLTGDLPALGPIVSTETYHVLRTGRINYDWKLPADLAGNSPRSARSAARPPDGAPAASVPTAQNSGSAAASSQGGVT
jgi:Lrp/AsnC family transcriptional regulator for asnA, asnC and gidA